MLSPCSLLFFVFVGLSIGFDSLVIAEFFKNHTHERILCWIAFFRLGLQFYLLSLFVMKKRFGIFYPALWLVVNILIIMVAVGTQVALEPPPIQFRWIIILASAGAMLCQCACVNLLRSTAVSLVTKHVFLRSKDSFSLAKNGNNNSNKNQESSDINDDEDRVALMEEGESCYPKWLEVKPKHWEKASRKRVEHIHHRWQKYLDSLRDRATDVGLFSDLASPLHFLVRLYMEESGKGEAARVAFEAFDVNLVAFRQYIPQITLFLIYASFENSAALQWYLLQASGKSIHVAHAIYWFTTAFCLRGAGVSPKGVATIKSFLEEVTIRGETPALMLCQDRSEQQLGEQSSSNLPHCSICRSSSTTIAASPAVMDLKSTFMDQNEVIAQHVSLHAQAFNAAPNFINELCSISRDIAMASKKDRKTELRKRLRKVCNEYLPSPVIYMPVGNRSHSVFAIHPEESFPFYPKNRAPYLLTLEVVDYDVPDEEMDLSRTQSVANRFMYWVKQMSYVRPSDREETQHLESNKNPKLYGAFIDKDGKGEGNLGQWGDHRASKTLRRSSVCSAPYEKRGIITLWRSLTSAVSLSGMVKGDNGSSTSISGAVHVDEDEDDDDSQCCDITNEGDDVESDLNNNPPTPVTAQLTKKKLPNSPALTESQTAVIFKERWKDKEARLRASSPNGHLPGWRLLPVIIKSCDDLRQEQLAAHFIMECHRALQEEKVPVWLRPYDIVATSPDSGVIEAVPDTVSIDAIKKNFSTSYSKTGNVHSPSSDEGGGASLLEFFELHFGEKGGEGFEIAQMRFARSLAGYSVVCYLLQIKDRHNGNLLIDEKGHLLHIDLGYCLANSPGGNFGFETAAFKLTSEMVEVLGGVRSTVFKKFRGLCVDAFMALRKHAHRITLLVELSSMGNSHLPCFDGRPRQVVDELRDRLMPHINDAAAREVFESCVMAAVGHWRTKWYDIYQMWTVGIAR
eukprot:379308_1